jgi:hypothetical protein
VKIVRREARSFLAHRITIAVACSIVIGLGLVRGYFGFIPRGVSLDPWLLARVDGPELRSPDGQRSVRVYFNDAGAMHRGNHWTWVIETNWWWFVGMERRPEALPGPDHLNMSKGRKRRAAISCSFSVSSAASCSNPYLIEIENELIVWRGRHASGRATARVGVGDFQKA